MDDGRRGANLCVCVTVVESIMQNRTPALVEQTDTNDVAAFKQALSNDRNALRSSIGQDAGKVCMDKFEQASAIVKWRALELLKTAPFSGPDEPVTCAPDISDIDATRSILETISTTGVVDAISVGNRCPNSRTLRSHGLCLMDLPEIVVDFDTIDGEVAQTIYTDLKTDALVDRTIGIAKLKPGRHVIAARFMRTYETKDGGSSPIWDVLACCAVPGFRSVRIVLHPKSFAGIQGGVDCAACGTILTEKHKMCPCKGVAYCGRKCQKAHWRFHKVACSCAPAPRPSSGLLEIVH